MSEYNNPDPDNEYILAGLSYFPLVNLFLMLTSSRSKYFVKYHAAHSIIIYSISLIILASYVAIYTYTRPLFADFFIIDVIFGLVFSFQLLVSFVYFLYCSIHAYQGNYLIIPVVTKLFYLIFNR